MNMTATAPAPRSAAALAAPTPKGPTQAEQRAQKQADRLEAEQQAWSSSPLAAFNYLTRDDKTVTMGALASPQRPNAQDSVLNAGPHFTDFAASAPEFFEAGKALDVAVGKAKALAGSGASSQAQAVLKSHVKRGTYFVTGLGTRDNFGEYASHAIDGAMLLKGPAKDVTVDRASEDLVAVVGVSKNIVFGQAAQK